MSEELSITLWQTLAALAFLTVLLALRAMV